MQFASTFRIFSGLLLLQPIGLPRVSKPTLVITMMGLCATLSASTTAQLPQSSQHKDIPTIAREADKSVVSVVVRDKRP
jgi:hypothetical protein